MLGLRIRDLFKIPHLPPTHTQTQWKLAVFQRKALLGKYQLARLENNLNTLGLSLYVIKVFKSGWWQIAQHDCIF